MVCHLVDSEQAWCHRMKRVIAEDKPLLIGYDESRFTAALGYHQHDLKSELALLEGMRLQMVLILRGLPESAWVRTGVHSERGLITLEEMLEAEVDHVYHHIRHIIEKRRAWDYRRVTVRRINRGTCLVTAARAARQAGLAQIRQASRPLRRRARGVEGARAP